DRPSDDTPAVADRARAARNLRVDAGAKCAPTRAANALEQPDAGRGLDGDRAARDDRDRDPLRLSCRRASPWPDGACGLWLAFAEEEGSTVRRPELKKPTSAATKALMKCEQREGHWLFELEADATIPAEYVLLRHFRGEPIAKVLERKIAVYLKRIQGPHGG